MAAVISRSCSSRRSLGNPVRIAALFALACLGWASTAPAAEQAVEGKKMLLKGTPKLVVLSRDGSIDVSGSDPECDGVDSSLVLDDGTQTATFLLPCENWEVNGAGTLQYRNAAAPEGASAIKLVRIKNGSLKIIGKGLGGIPVPSGAGTIDVVLNLDGISNRYCLTFTGSGDGSRFVVKDAGAGSCPASSACEATTGGLCWYLSDDDASCDATCGIAGRAYDSATASYAGSGGDDANCNAVLDALGVPAGPLTTSSSCFDGVGCFYAAPAGRFRCAAPATNASSEQGERACACL